MLIVVVGELLLALLFFLLDVKLLVILGGFTRVSRVDSL